jgi:hypothetical protein
MTAVTRLSDAIVRAELGPEVAPPPRPGKP